MNIKDMRFTILLCVAGLLAAGPVFGEARDTLRLKIAPPRVMVPETVVLTDSIPGAFIEKLDALYEMWYVTKHGGEGDGGLFYEPEGGQVSMPDSVYLARLDSLNSAIRLSYNDIVRNYIEVYVVRGRAQSGVLLGLSDYYFPIFEEVLVREGLPLELAASTTPVPPVAITRSQACMAA